MYSSSYYHPAHASIPDPYADAYPDSYTPYPFPTSPRPCQAEHSNPHRDHTSLYHVGEVYPLEDEDSYSSQVGQTYAHQAEQSHPQQAEHSYSHPVEDSSPHPVEDSYPYHVEEVYPPQATEPQYFDHFAFLKTVSRTRKLGKPITIRLDNLPTELSCLAYALHDLIPTTVTGPITPSFLSTSEKNQLRNTIDQGASILANIYSYRNALAPISILPAELLCEVLYLAMLQAPRASSCATFTSVCRQWYNIVTQHGKLWSHIDENIHHWRLYERRSKGHPLTLRHTSLLCSHEFKRNAHRVADLDVSGDRHNFFFFFEDLQSVPQLEKLRIQLYQSHREEGNSITDSWYLPSVLFEGGALRHVYLKNVYFSDPKTLLLLNNLTHLELERSSWSPATYNSSMPTLVDILLLLTQSRHLQHLKLNHYAAQPGSPDDVHIMLRSLSQCPNIINLLALQTLSLSHLHQSTVDVLLRRLSFPPSMRISLDLFWSTPSDYTMNLQSIFSHLNQHARGPGAPTFRSARISLIGGFEFSVFEEDSLPDRDASPHGVQPILSLRLIHCTQTQARQLLSAILSLPLEHVAFIDATDIIYAHGDVEPSGLRREREFSPRTWRFLFASLPCNLTVRIGVNTAMEAMLTGLLDAMRRAPTRWRTVKRMTNSCAFGALPIQKLILLRDRHPYRDYPNYDDSEELQAPLYTTLIAKLQAYQSMQTALKPSGTPLPFLHFDRICPSEVIRPLYDVSGELAFHGDVWSPEGERKRRREWRKWKRSMRLEYPEWYPDGEVDSLSELSDESGSDS